MLIAPPFTNMFQLARLSVEPQAFGFTNPASRDPNLSALHTATSHPFPTLWFAKDGTPGLVKLLPSEETLLEYLDLFENQVQPIMFPHMPLACTRSEVQRFLSNVHRNASLHPDMLALIFTAVALGIANVVDQQQSGRLNVGLSEHESAKGDVFSRSYTSLGCSTEILTSLQLLLLCKH